MSINTLKAETIESKYIPPTIDEEKIMESLKDKNRSKTSEWGKILNAIASFCSLNN